MIPIFPRIPVVWFSKIIVTAYVVAEIITPHFAETYIICVVLTFFPISEMTDYKFNILFPIVFPCFRKVANVRHLVKHR